MSVVTHDVRCEWRLVVGELGIPRDLEEKSGKVRGLCQNLALKICVCARLAHLATGGRSALFADPQFDGYMRVPDRSLDGNCACIPGP